MRKILASLTVVAAAAAAVALPATSSAQNTNLRVYVSNCEKQVYKPSAITVFCGDSGVVIQKIKYSSYGAKTAAGTGTAVVNLCDPNCAAGKTKNYPVKFTLSKVKQCGDSYQFQKLQMTYTGAVPKGQKKTSTQSYGCANAPTR
jgi:hypothetical protein